MSLIPHIHMDERGVDADARETQFFSYLGYLGGGHPLDLDVGRIPPHVPAVRGPANTASVLRATVVRRAPVARCYDDGMPYPIPQLLELVHEFGVDDGQAAAVCR